MTGKELKELIKNDKVEDFEIEFRFSEVDEKGINIRTFKIDRVFLDIGYSDKMAFLTGEE